MKNLKAKDAKKIPLLPPPVNKVDRPDYKKKLKEAIAQRRKGSSASARARVDELILPEEYNQCPSVKRMADLQEVVVYDWGKHSSFVWTDPPKEYKEADAKDNPDIVKIYDYQLGRNLWLDQKEMVHKEGYHFFGQGERLKDCHYPEGTRHAEWWKSGWRKAAADKRKAQEK